MPPMNKRQFGEKMASVLKAPASNSPAYDSKVLQKPHDNVWRGPMGTSHRMTANRSADV